MKLTGSEQQRNRRPGLESVHDVRIIESAPQLQRFIIPDLLIEREIRRKKKQVMLSI